MTSEEIKRHSQTFPHPETDGFWLKEIAYQLARANERAEGAEAADCLRSCAQTISENNMDGPAAVDYLMRYAHTIESATFPRFGNRLVKGRSVAGLEGFEPPRNVDVIRTHYYERNPADRFCRFCGGGEFHTVHTPVAKPPKGKL